MSFDDLMRRLLFLPEAATEFARSVDRLHFFVILVTMAGAAIVAFAALVFLLRYGRKGRPLSTPRVRASVGFEGLVIGGLLSLFLLWWVIGFRQYIAYATPPAGDAVEIYVTAKQWMWKFASPSGRASIGVLVVPEGRVVRLIMTSRDVIHSFYVPAFRLKRDVLPGRFTVTWFDARDAGVYDVHCAEFCGTEHSRMSASVVVLPPDLYERWLDGEEPEPVARAGARLRLGGGQVGDVEQVDMAEHGQRLAAAHGCFACHTIDGQPHIGPTWQGLFGKRVALESGDVVRADEAYLTRSMMDPHSDIVAGFQPVMPTYLGTLENTEAAAIVQFIKSLHPGQRSPEVRLPEARVVAQDGGPPAAHRDGASRDAGSGDTAGAR